MIVRVHAGQVLGEPLPQLLHEDVGVVEQAIDQVDRLALERLQPRREPLAGHLGRIAAGIMHSHRLGHSRLLKRLRTLTS